MELRALTAVMVMMVEQLGLEISEAPTDTSRSNMGIGLSVCRTIIRAHGSDIRAKNRAEGGTIFSFSLELEETNDVK